MTLSLSFLVTLFSFILLNVSQVSAATLPTCNAKDVQVIVSSFLAPSMTKSAREFCSNYIYYYPVTKTVATATTTKVTKRVWVTGGPKSITRNTIVKVITTTKVSTTTPETTVTEYITTTFTPEPLNPPAPALKERGTDSLGRPYVFTGLETYATSAISTGCSCLLARYPRKTVSVTHYKTVGLIKTLTQHPASVVYNSKTAYLTISSTKTVETLTHTESITVTKTASCGTPTLYGANFESPDQHWTISSSHDDTVAKYSSKSSLGIDALPANVFEMSIPTEHNIETRVSIAQTVKVCKNQYYEFWIDYYFDYPNPNESTGRNPDCYLTVTTDGDAIMKAYPPVGTVSPDWDGAAPALMSTPGLTEIKISLVCPAGKGGVTVYIDNLGVMDATMMA